MHFLTFVTLCCLATLSCCLSTADETDLAGMFEDLEEQGLAEALENEMDERRLEEEGRTEALENDLFERQTGRTPIWPPAGPLRHEPRHKRTCLRGF